MSNKYPQCESCVNREFDPFVCEECEDGDLYESEDEEEDMSLDEFKKLMRMAA